VAEFTDLVTSLAQVNLNTLAQAQSYVVSGGLPSLSGTLTLSQPATTAVVLVSGSAVVVTTGVTPLVFTASSTQYVDLSTTGTYTITTSSTVTANSTRLYKTISNGTQVTSITQLNDLFSTGSLVANSATPSQPLGSWLIAAANEATNLNPAVSPTDTLQQTIWRILYKLNNGGAGGVLQSAVGYDSTEAFTASGSSSLLDNMNHLRKAAASLFGSTWANTLANAKAAILSDGTNAGSAVGMGSSAVSVASLAASTTVTATGLVTGSGIVLGGSGIQTGGSTPSITNLPTNTSLNSISGNNSAGKVVINLNTGFSLSSNNAIRICTVNFNPGTTYGTSVPLVQLTMYALGYQTVVLSFFNSNTSGSANSFDVYMINVAGFACAGPTTLQFSYFTAI
jgi:hypothetical protein